MSKAYYVPYSGLHFTCTLLLLHETGDFESTFYFGNTKITVPVKPGGNRYLLETIALERNGLSWSDAEFLFDY